MGRVAAVAVKATATEAAGPPGVRVPLSGKTLSQAAVLAAVQVKELLPVLVRVSVNEVGAKGPPTGPLLTKPSVGVIRKSSGKSKDSWTPVVVELAGDVALEPMPRLAKAAHNSVRLAPPLLTKSACKMALRACKKLGFAGDRFMPSVTNCRMSWLPTAQPYLVIKLARA